MIEPYYESARATLYLGDAADVLLDLPRNSVDLIATDPPYGVTWRSGRRDKRFEMLAGDDGTLDVTAVIGLALQALRTCRHLYVFGPADLSELPVTKTVQLVWDKGQVGPGDLSSPWGPQHENIQFGVYVPSQKNRAGGGGKLSARLRQGSVLRVNRLNSRAVKRHPTEKPVALMRQLVESSSVMGDTVLDPFAGVGSTLVAAVLEGRHGLGIEVDEGFCRIAAERLRAIEAVLDQIEVA